MNEATTTKGRGTTTEVDSHPSTKLQVCEPHDECYEGDRRNLAFAANGDAIGRRRGGGGAGGEQRVAVVINEDRTKKEARCCILWIKTSPSSNTNIKTTPLNNSNRPLLKVEIWHARVEVSAPEKISWFQRLSGSQYPTEFMVLDRSCDLAWILWSCMDQDSPHYKTERSVIIILLLLTEISAILLVS